MALRRPAIWTVKRDPGSGTWYVVNEDGDLVASRILQHATAERIAALPELTALVSRLVAWSQDPEADGAAGRQLWLEAQRAAAAWGHVSAGGDTWPRH